MIRLRSTPSLALAVALVGMMAALLLSSCSSSSLSGNAVVVNGDAVSNKDFEAQLKAISSNTAYLKVALPADSSGATPAATDGSNNYSTDFTTQALNQQVTFLLAAQEVSRRGLTVSDDDKTKAASVLANDLGQQTTDPSTGQAVSDGSGQAVLDDLGVFKDVLVNGVANILAIQNDITKQLSTDEALKTAYDAGGDTYKNQACTSIIILDATVKDPTTGSASAPTDASFAAALTKAQGLVGQIKSPTDFATVAQANSDDSTSAAKGGDLGCAAVGAYAQQQPEIDAVISSQPVGTVSAPVKASFGYAIVLVRSRGDLSFEDAKPQLKSGVSAAMKTAFQNWLNQGAKDADVTVDPKWGSWDKDNGTVVAPGGSTSSTSTTSIDPNASTTSSLSPEQLQQLLQSSGGASTPSSTP